MLPIFPTLTWANHEISYYSQKGPDHSHNSDQAYTVTISLHLLYAVH